MLDFVELIAMLKLLNHVLRMNEMNCGSCQKKAGANAVKNTGLCNHKLVIVAYFVESRRSCYKCYDTWIFLFSHLTIDLLDLSSHPPVFMITMERKACVFVTTISNTVPQGDWHCRATLGSAAVRTLGWASGFVAG